MSTTESFLRKVSKNRIRLLLTHEAMLFTDKALLGYPLILAYKIYHFLHTFVLFTLFSLDHLPLHLFFCFECDFVTTSPPQLEAAGRSVFFGTVHSMDVGFLVAVGQLIVFLYTVALSAVVVVAVGTDVVPAVGAAAPILVEFAIAVQYNSPWQFP